MGDATIVAACIASRSWEVGIAVMNLTRPGLHLQQISDDRRFSATVRVLEGYEVQNVLFPATHVNSPLKVTLDKRGSAMTLVPRRHFSEDQGMVRLVALAASKLEQRDLERRHLARSAAAALLRSVELAEGATFCTGALQISLDDTLAGRLAMDHVTIRNLELLENRRRRARGAQAALPATSLLALLDNTVSGPGNRRLRAELARPPADLATITGRQNAIRVLVADQSKLHELRTTVEAIHDLDQLSSHYAVRPKVYTVRTLKREADNAIRMREALSQIENLSQALGSVETEVFASLRASLAQTRPGLSSILAEIDAQLVPTARFRRGVEEQRMEALFCIRPGVDGVLDVARSVLQETVDSMREYKETLREEFPDLDIELSYSARRGYFLRIPRKQFAHAHSLEREREQVFIRRALGKTRMDCTTEALEALNIKQEQAAAEGLKRIEARLASVGRVVRTAMCDVFAAADIVSQVDLLQALAQFSIAHGDSVVEPRMMDLEPRDKSNTEQSSDTSEDRGCALSIREGRHPLVEAALDGTGSFVANDIVIGRDSPLCVVSGVNCAGKSTLLCQTALISILAHLGAPVPARLAHLPILGRVLTRIGTEDNLEANASTFSLEMSETAHILQVTKEHSESVSLILLDELGRGTSTREGFALAWAISEALLQVPGTVTLLATHFSRLEQLSCYTARFQANVDSATRTLLFSFRALLGKGQAPVSGTGTADPNALPSKGHSSCDRAQPSDYGIQLASVCGFPREVISAARTARRELEERHVALIARRRRLVALLRDASVMGDESLRQSLASLS